MKHIVIDARIRRSSTGRYVDRLIEHLQDIDDQNSYTVLINPEDPWKPKSSNFITLPSPYAQFSLNPMQQIRFTKQLYSLHADLVHFSMTGHAPLFYFGRQVTTTHDLTMFTYARKGQLPAWIHWIRMRGYGLIVWWAHRIAKKIITPTDYVRKTVAKHYPFTSSKLVVTYEASEPPLKVPAKKPEFINSKTPFLLYVGTAFPHKNLRLIVDAMPQLLEHEPKLKVVLAGKKEQYYERLQKHVSKLDYRDHVIIPGFVSDEELKWLYQHCAVYVFPSFSEGFGLPGLEAMVHGAPVVSSNATCLPEVYGNAALYFNPSNVDDAVHKIERVLRDKEFKKELITKGREQVKKFSWKTMAQQTLDVYKKVLEI